jgi:type VI secretion system protein ImpE
VNIKELIKKGKFSEARAALVLAVKNYPKDTASRTLLFQVLLFSGEWDKAERHLEVLADLDSTMDSGVSLYKNLLKCERERVDVVAQRATPSFLPATPAYFEDYGKACRSIESDRDGGGSDVFRAMESMVPQVTGTVNGVEFLGMRNTDDMLAFALEVFAYDRYVWVPFEAIREIIITPPASLLDLIWIPALITTWGGLSLNGFLPVLYPETWKHEEERVRMGRMTDWSSTDGGIVRGAGPQVFIFADQDISILDLRDIQFKMTMQADETSINSGTNE